MSSKVQLFRRSATLTTVPLAAIANEQPDDKPAFPVWSEEEQKRQLAEIEKANAESYERYLAPRIAAAKEMLAKDFSLTTVTILLNVEQAVLETRLGLTEPQPSAAKAAKATRRKKA